MQVDRLNHLLFPPDNSGKSASSNKDAATGANATGGSALTRAKAPVAVEPVKPVPAPVPAGVVLIIQNTPQSTSDSSELEGANAPIVYSNQRKGAVPVPSERAVENMAHGHPSAGERNVGAITRMSVDKDGVLVAKPQSASGSKPDDFVSIAVSALRTHADEQERLKKVTADAMVNADAAAAAAAADSPQASVPTATGILRGFQQLAARYNVFA